MVIHHYLAQELVNRVLNIDENTPRARYVQACIYEQKQLFSKALDEYKYYLSLPHSDTFIQAIARNKLITLPEKSTY